MRFLFGSLLVAIVVASALVVTTTSQWAQRGPMRARGMSEDDLRGVVLMKRALKEIPFFSVVKRPASLAPLGDDYKPNIPGARARKNLIETPSGWVDLKAPQAFVDRLPGELRGGGAGSVTARGKWKMTGRGVNILQIDQGALADRGYGAIEAAVKATGARVLATMPSRGMAVRAGSPKIARALGELPFVEAAHEFAPGMKVFANTGKMALANQARALAPHMKLRVQLWIDAPREQARRQIEKIVGKGKVVEHSLNGSTFVVEANRGMARRIAQNRHVASLSEASEFVLSNQRGPTILMVGNSYNFGFTRPYHDAGIDGGGIDTNGDGVRDNRPSNPDEVPPQIVAVTDNGISYDAVHFSHTATQPAIPLIAPVGPTHRKVHAIQNVADGSLSTCDAILSGSGTHGNVVAGIIAGNPSELGFTYNDTDDPAARPEFGGMILDATARGARILMQDAADSTVCTNSEAFEQGGNVFPGSLMDRLNQAICPKSNPSSGTPCAGLTGGADEVHLQVMPFGTPNWDNSRDNAVTPNGSYTVESHEVDRFLMNNRDYMVFVPVGNKGVLPEDPWFLMRFPDLFNGSAFDNDPNADAEPLQVTAPATAKNIVSVGTVLDIDDELEGFWTSELPVGPHSKGPATALSLRTAPLLVTSTWDFGGEGDFAMAATNRSRDNDNNAPVENQVDGQNLGSSFSAAVATAGGAIVRDYFAQGFYPTGSRQTADRMPQVSGALVKAALVASANFQEDIRDPIRVTTEDRWVASARSIHLGTVSGPGGSEDVGVIGNNVQGFGRIVLNNVLPIPNYTPAQATIQEIFTPESPVAGLIVHDTMATGELPIDNSGEAPGSIRDFTFTVDGPDAIIDADTGARVLPAGQLRIALAWPDPPSAAGGGGLLVNDLDLEVESPGPDNDINTPDDNLFYDGNIYIKGQPLPAGQWSQHRLATDTAVHDDKNPVEAVHLSAVVDDATPNQLVTGSWRVWVMLGDGGYMPGEISMIDGADEDRGSRHPVYLGWRLFRPGQHMRHSDGLSGPGRSGEWPVRGLQWLRGHGRRRPAGRRRAAVLPGDRRPGLRGRQPDVGELGARVPRQPGEDRQGALHLLRHADRQRLRQQCHDSGGRLAEHRRAGR
jgi:hypothetical protein